MNERMQLGVAFASPDSRIDQAIMTVNSNRSIKISKSVPLAGQLPAIGWHYDKAAGMAGRAADSPIIECSGDEITLVLRLGVRPGRSGSAGPAVSPANMARSKRRCGEVTSWQPDRDRGFIRDSVTGESFWFSPKQLVYADSAENLAIGTKLAFVATGTAKGRKSRQAAGILVVGEKADGRLISRHRAGKRCGWVRVEGDQGNHPLVYVPRRELSGCKVGDILTFAVAANEKGPFASRVERLAEDEAGIASGVTSFLGSGYLLAAASPLPRLPRHLDRRPPIVPPRPAPAGSQPPEFQPPRQGPRATTPGSLANCDYAPESAKKPGVSRSVHHCQRWMYPTFVGLTRLLFEFVMQFKRLLIAWIVRTGPPAATSSTTHRRRSSAAAQPRLRPPGCCPVTAEGCAQHLRVLS